MIRTHLIHPKAPLPEFFLARSREDRGDDYPGSGNNGARTTSYQVEAVLCGAGDSFQGRTDGG